MAKINYRVCDICGCVLQKDVRMIRFINGYRIWNRLFNNLDICNTCMEKIRLLSMDKEDEEKYVESILKNTSHYDGDCLIAYYEGVEAALGVLNHKKLKNIVPKK